MSEFELESIFLGTHLAGVMLSLGLIKQAE